MSKVLSNNNINVAAAADPQTAPTPEQLVEQFHAVRRSLPEVSPLTADQRRLARRRMRVSNEILQAQINVMTVSSAVEQVVGLPSADVRQIADDANRWTAVEDALRTLLASVEGGNLVRRERLALVAGLAYNVGVSLAAAPEHAELVPQVDEVRRLKRLARRKKASSPEVPQPAPAEEHGTVAM
jgi:hypothetical protein